MKKIYLSSFLFVFCLASYSQIINTGGFHAGFGIDADTRSGYTKYGPVPAANAGDDWFAGDNGRGVLDTTNAGYYKSLLQNNNNISFTQRMSVPVYTKVNGI